MHRLVIAATLGSLAIACTDTSTPPAAQTPPKAGDSPDPDGRAEGADEQDASPSTRLAAGVRGRLLRVGEPLDLATAQLDIHAEHCREPRVPKVSVRIDAKKDVDPVIVITGDTTTVQLGVKHTPATDDDRAERPVRIGVYASGEGRVASYQLPQTAWVRFHALALGGPVDVDFEASFGELGQIEGSVRLETTTETTCVVPAPPPPPG